MDISGKLIDLILTIVLLTLKTNKAIYTGMVMFNRFSLIFGSVDSSTESV